MSRHPLQEPDPPRYPGDWIPYGRAPLELIPAPDYGPIIGSAYPHILGGDRTGKNLVRWHRLKKAGLR